MSLWDMRMLYLLTIKLAVVTLYSYFPALLDQTIRMACELVRIVSASVTTDLYQKGWWLIKNSNKYSIIIYQLSYLRFHFALVLWMSILVSPPELKLLSGTGGGEKVFIRKVKTRNGFYIKGATLGTWKQKWFFNVFMGPVPNFILQQRTKSKSPLIKTNRLTEEIW